MARHYSTKDFFRQMPNALLARYFKTRGLFVDLEFEAMKEGNPNQLFEAWVNMPEEQRNPMDAEFRSIFDMSCEKGFRAIIDEARWQMRKDPAALGQFIETLSTFPNHYHRAMVTFLDHSECWKGATLFYHADTLPYWRKRKNMGHSTTSVDEASIDQLANLICTFFRSEGRGNHCLVEPFRRGELDYFFCYPEDYSQQGIEWVDDELDRRPHNPAFEIVYVYSQLEGSLDLNFRGSPKAVEPLQGIFATAILKLDELPTNPEDQRVYDLNPLLQKNFTFNYALSSGIKSVAVKKLRLSSWVTKGDRITLEADTTEDPQAVYTLLKQISYSIPLCFYNVTQVELTVSLVVDIQKPAKTIPIRITYPNSCSLKYDEIDLKLRDMLETSGIELKEPQQKLETKEVANE